MNRIKMRLRVLNLKRWDGQPIQYRSYHSTRAGLRMLCDDDLRKYVSLPKNCQYLDAVFTKEPHADSFKIARPYIGFHYGRQSHIVTVPKNIILPTSRRALTDAWDRDFRYVHFEVNA